MGWSFINLALRGTLRRAWGLGIGGLVGVLTIGVSACDRSKISNSSDAASLPSAGIASTSPKHGPPLYTNDAAVLRLPTMPLKKAADLTRAE